MVIQRSCSSLRVSVKRVSPALAPAIIPALDTYIKPNNKIIQLGHFLIYGWGQTPLIYILSHLLHIYQMTYVCI